MIFDHGVTNLINYSCICITLKMATLVVKTYRGLLCNKFTFIHPKCIGWSF